MQNRVVVICEDHHNGLGVARCFGRNGIKAYAIIVGQSLKNSFVSKSKFWEKCYEASNADEAISVLLDSFTSNLYKTVVIPCSDKIARAIDLNYDLFPDCFVLPNIGKKSGAIAELMDKEKQIKLAKDENIQMLESIVINKSEFDACVFKNVPYPCIVKPVSSHEGNKRDIIKCDTEEDLHEKVKVLFDEKGYSRVLIQRWLNYDFEGILIGGISSIGVSYIVLKKIRVWPKVGGSSSFLQVINSPTINGFCKKIISVFAKLNFVGLFDVELFCVGEAVYLNEINWRNSGAVYATKGTGVEYPLIWYMDMVGINSDSFKRFCFDESIYAMNENDINHVFKKDISFREWKKAKKQSCCFAVWDKKDAKPARKRYSQLLKRIFIKNKQ